MILRITLMQKLDGMTNDAFHTHWRVVHAPLATKLNGLALYHLNAVNEPLTTEPTVLPLWPIDGVAQLGFANMEAMKLAGATAAGKADRVNFIKTQQTLVCQRSKAGPNAIPSQSSAKCMLFFSRRPDISVEEFDRAWEKGDSDGIEQLPGFVARIKNEVVDRWPEPWVSAPYSDMPIDGVEELWFDSAQSLAAAFACASMRGIEKARSTYVEKTTALRITAHRVIG